MAELESLTVSLDDQFSQSANTAATSAGNLAAGLDKVSTSSQTVDTAMRTRGQTVDSINKKIADQASLTDRLATIEQKYQAAVVVKVASMQAEAASATQIAEAIRRLGVVRDEDTQKATSSFEKLDQKFVATQQAAVQSAQSIADLTRSYAAAAQSAKSIVMSSGGFSFAQDRGADIAAYGTELDRLRAKFNPLFAASKQYENLLGEISDAERVGAISASEAAKARETATAAFAKSNGPVSDSTKGLNGLTDSSRNANTQMRLLGVQAIQTASGLATGQPILTTLIQQGHQVADSLLATGTGFGALKGAFSGAVSAVGPLNIALLATYGALATLGVSAEHESQRLSNLRQQLRATHDDYATLATSVDASARQIAATTTASTAQARTAAQTIASAAYFKGTQADIVNLATVSLNLAKVWNEDVAKSAEFLKGALDDPGKAAQELADKHFPGMTQALATSVAQMQTAGHAGDGLNVVLGVLKNGTAGATDDQSKLSTALKNLEKSFYGAQEGGKSLATTLGDFVNARAAEVVHGMENVIEVIKGVTSAAKTALAVTGSADQQRTTAYPGGINPETGQVITIPSGTSSSGQQVLQGPVIEGKTERAAGIFQVLPSTGRDMGYDVNDPTQNVKAGLTYLNQQIGNNGVDAGLARYGGYGTNVTKAQGYISNVLGSDTASLPTTVSGQIDYWGNVLGMSPGMIEIGKKLAVVESGGRQYTTGTTDFGRGGASYSGSILSATGTNNVTGVTAGGYDTMSQPGVSQSMIDEQKKWNDELDKSAQKTREIENAGYDKFITTLKAQMEQEAATTGKDTAAYREHAQILDETVAKRRANVDAMTTAQRASESSLASNNALTAAEQRVAAAVEARRQVSLTSRGTELSSAEAAQAVTNVLKEQSQEFAKVTFSLATASANSLGMADAYNKGDQAVIDATAQQSAYNEALTLFPRNSAQFSAAYASLTEDYKQNARAAADAKTAQANLNSRDNLAYIATETSSLGMNEDARNRLLAVMKAEQAMHVQFGDVLPKEAQDYIKLAGATADATSAFQHQQAVTSELGTFFTNTFDTIANSITSAFANGTLSALKFKDIAMSVASAVLSEFVKLAVLNPLKSLLFGSTNGTVTLSDVLGLLGGATSIGAAASGSSASGVANLVFTDGSKVATTTGGSGASGASGSSGSTLLTGASGVVTIAGAAGKSGLFGDLFKDLPFNNLSSFGSWIVSNTISTLGGEAALSAATSAATNAALGTIGVADGSGAVAGALAIPGAAVQGVIAPTAGQVAGAAVGQAVGLSDAGTAALSTAAGQVVAALPYIGVAVSLISDLAQGNLRGAGLVAAGAATGFAVGTIFPVIGNAVGAAVGAAIGGLVDTFFPAHPLHSYQGTEVMIDNGQLVAGKTAAQVQSSDSAVASINEFGTALNTYMDKVGIVLTNLNGTLGDVGQGITGLTQYASVQDPAILSKLQFAGNPNDTSNFGVAKGALVDMQFNSIGDLTTELLKIAGFADAASAMGIQLKHVAKDISNIQIAGVSGANPNALGSVTDAQGNIVQYHNDLRTALNTDLPSQTFADTTALDTEISKVNTFVNETLPQLLTPIEKTSSSITTAVDNIDKTYSDAINQSLQYGLDNTAVLREAEAQAISIVRRTALMSLTQDYTSIVNRFILATNDNVYTQQQATLDALRATQANEIETFTKSWTDIFGDGVKSSAAFQASLQGLTNTLGVEFTAKVNATSKAIQAQYDALWQSFQSNYMVRDLQAQGNNKDADLLSYDVKAEQERQTYIDQQEAFWGDQITGNQGFQDQLALIDKVHGEERLAIVQKYATAATTALQTAVDTTLSQAQGQVTSLFGNLTTYAHTLQSGADSPLSPTAQYALASSQFDAVAGAAKAGDYTSASQLQTYAQSLQTASRSVNGSGAQYAADVGRILDAISGTAANADMLTLSAQQAIVREQTQAQVDAAQKTTDAVVALQDEVKALRREVQQQARAA